MSNEYELSEEIGVPEERVDVLYKRLDQEAEASGYHLNPDREFTRELVRGLLVNEERYGYWACPCRLADGDKQKDLDIICPCNYRDADLLDSCALVSDRSAAAPSVRPNRTGSSASGERWVGT